MPYQSQSPEYLPKQGDDAPQCVFGIPWLLRGSYLAMFESIDLGDTNWRAQMMLVGGIALLIWVMFRRNLRVKQQSRRDDVAWRAERVKMQARSESGAPLADAPVDVARWQSGMFDLQRDLKAELDTRIAIVQSLVRRADQRIELLQQLSVHTPVLDLRKRSLQVAELANRGKTPAEIADSIGLSIGDVEFLLSVSTEA